ncbi:helix-turn-helix domain-containing protein [Streptosporangium roseum]|uniref:helix-turn-helix domain-containing protein n=1 Tax=Streptosporangium roseum TaxID=2001 RepID=UPI0012DE223B|nr:helix-turn-helix domain-containing protein [Streptosporangium roseum]
MTADAPIEMVTGHRVPFAMVAEWVMLSGISAQAQALYVQACMHLNQRRGDGEVWPSRDDLAARLGYSRAATVDPYIKELVTLGAFTVSTRRFANGMRARNHYIIHKEPPAHYSGPRSLAEYYDRKKPVRHDESTADPVVRYSALPASAPADTGSAAQRMPVVRSVGSRSSRPADGNQTKSNHTKPNQTKPSSFLSTPAPAQTEGGDGGKIIGGGVVADPPLLAEPAAGDAAQDPQAGVFLRGLPAPWRLTSAAVSKAAPVITAALAAGWPAKALREHLTHAPEGVHSYDAVLLHRLANLPQAPLTLSPQAGTRCPQHPGAALRGLECAGCWADQQN